MAVSFVGAGAEASGASGGLTLNAPASPQNGDIWIAVIHVSDQGSISMSGDWTQIFQANGGGTTSRLAVFWHRYAGSSPSLTVTHTGGQSPIGGIAAFRGCWATGSPIDTTGSGGSGTDASIEIAGFSPTADNCMLVICDGAADDNNRSTLPTGFAACFEDTAGGTQNCYQTTAGNPDGSVACHWKLHTSGATGNFTDTMSAADPWASVMTALKPAPEDLSITCAVGTADVAGQLADAQPGAVTVQATVKIVDTTGYAVTVSSESPSVTIICNVGTMDTAGAPAGIQPGSVILQAVAAQIQISGFQASVKPGPVKADISAGLVITAGSQADVQPGGVSVGVSAAITAVSGQIANVKPGPVSISTGVGALSVSGYLGDIKPGPVVVKPVSGVLASSGHTAQAGSITSINVLTGAVATETYQAGIQPGPISADCGVGTVVITGHSAQVLVVGAVTIQAAVGALSVVGWDVYFYARIAGRVVLTELNPALVVVERLLPWEVIIEENEVGVAITIAQDVFGLDIETVRLWEVEIEEQEIP